MNVDFWADIENWGCILWRKPELSDVGTGQIVWMGGKTPQLRRNARKLAGLPVHMKLKRTGPKSMELSSSIMKIPSSKSVTDLSHSFLENGKIMSL